tara:strand:+ start:76 stop:342 length:267 start_codon:yes stop_codon:yes gene_type:complete
MSRLIKIRAYRFEELNDKARENFAHQMYDMPFDSETGEYDDEGNAILEYDYFAEWHFEEQIEYCEMNEYLFDKYGNLISHLEEKSDVS